MNDFTKDEPIEEGAKCTDDNCTGVYELNTPVNCKCHISPPCEPCLMEGLKCSECGELPDYE